MHTRRARLCFALGVTLMALCARPARAAGPAVFTVTVGGAFLRSDPRLTAPLTVPVFAGEQHALRARSPDNVWLKLETKTGAGWLLAQYGSTPADLASLPAPPTATPRGAKRAPAAQAAAPPWARFVSPVTPAAKKRYLSKAPNKNLAAFTVAGDCNSITEAFLGRLASGTFDASKYPEYAAVIERFAPSFARESQAANSGFNSGSMFDPEWANPNHCMPGEGVLPCELRRSQAAIVILSLGTGDQFTWKDFEKHYRGILDALLKAGTLPVLVTKADALEQQQGGAPAETINNVVRALGAEYGLPVLDFHAATRALPNQGLREEGNEDFHMNAAGSNMRILLTLQALREITK